MVSNKQSHVSPTDFQKKILDWFDHFGRKNLPWQFDKTAYRVWVSEIMLQQTQASTVIPYFERFMKRFPTMHALSSSIQDEILHLWTGLGYYSRARNLHRSAQLTMQHFKGELPNTLDELLTLPGIGRSTAGAILAIAFKQKAAILDGNVKRVLTRVFGITDWPGEKKVSDTLWNIAESLTPENRVEDYTQAIMDIGATVCIRGKPQCEVCPLTTLCAARKLGIEKTLPHPKPKKKLPIRQATFLVLRHEKSVLLKKRPPTGIWGGLWSLPELPDFLSHDAIHNYCQQHFKLSPQQVEMGQPFRHTFSHFHLDMLPVFVTVIKKPTKIMEDDQQIWYNLSKSQAVGLPAPVKKLLRNLLCHE